MRALYLFVALGVGAVWISCGGSGTDNLFPGSGGALGASGNVSGGSGQTGSGSSGSNTGGAVGVGGAVGAGGALGDGGKGSGGAAGQAGSAPAAGGAAGMSGSSGGAGMAGSAMGGNAGSIVVDAGIDAPPAGPQHPIRCGMMSCDADTEFCCLDEPRSCLPLGSNNCDRNRNRLHCDDASDCNSNQRCCVTDPSGGDPRDATCRENNCGTLGGRGAQILCADSQQCPDSDPMCSPTALSLLPTYSYCH